MNLECTGLPQQQSKTLKHAALGNCIKLTARQMGVSISTVKSHREALMAKMGTKNTPQAISEAFRRGNLNWVPAIMAFILSVIALAPAPVVAADDDDPMMRRTRTRLSGRHSRRLQSAADLHFDPQFASFFGLSPELVWDDGLFVVYR